MTGLSSCREIRQALGVYVLGAIDPAERAQVDAHLATCPDCREELASLAGLPAMLRKVPVVEAERLASPDAEPDLSVVPSEEMLKSLVARTTNVRRIHRWRGALAAAAAVIVALGGGAAIATAIQSGGSQQVDNAHWRTALGGAAGIHLTVRYRQVASGTLIETNVIGVPLGTTCQFQVVDDHGNVMPLGSWVYWHGSSWYPASSSLSDAQLRTFQLAVGGKVVASAPA
jgi:predicted anti-sigma-YlaC factor YlaD